MEDNICIRLCMNCKFRCVVRKKNGVISYYGCFGRKGYRDFIKDFSRTIVVSQVFAMSTETGRFVSPLKEFDFAKAIKGYEQTPVGDQMEFSMDDTEFHNMIVSEFDACELLPEIELAEWSKKDASN